MDKIIKEIATKVNKKVNIPFLSEKVEQALIEKVISVVLSVLDEITMEKING